MILSLRVGSTVSFGVLTAVKEWGLRFAVAAPLRIDVDVHGSSPNASWFLDTCFPFLAGVARAGFSDVHDGASFRLDLAIWKFETKEMRACRYAECDVLRARRHGPQPKQTQ